MHRSSHSKRRDRDVLFRNLDGGVAVYPQYPNGSITHTSEKIVVLVLRAFNVTRQTVVAKRLRVAETIFSRLMGLLGRSRLDLEEGLWIRSCRAIHTFGMRFPIDVIFLDAQQRVVKTVAGVAPFQICLGGRVTRSVLELPVGTIEQSCTRPGDQIHFIEDA